MIGIWRRTLRLVAATARGYLDDRGPQLSAAIAYFGLVTAPASSGQRHAAVRSRATARCVA